MDRKNIRHQPLESNGDIIGWRNDYQPNNKLPNNNLKPINNNNSNNILQAVADSFQQQPNSVIVSSNNNLPNSTSVWDTIMKKRTTYIRAMTSRLAEIKELSAVWKNKELPSSTRSVQPPSSSSSTSLLTVYYNALLQLRDSAHEWTAVDVLNTLTKCNGVLHIPRSLLIENDDNEVNTDDNNIENEDTIITIQLQGGIPLWIYPTYPSIDYLPYLLPVIENLLYSCYEDYIQVALETNKYILLAIEPIFQLAADCDENDLQYIPNNNPEDKITKIDDKEDESKINTESKDNDTSQLSIRSESEKWKDYIIATQAVEIVDKTIPLLTALKSASTNPGSTAKIAHSQVIKYSELHASVKHLTSASKFL